MGSEMCIRDSLTGADPLIHQCKRELAFEFEMKDLGLMHYFLGLEVAETW